MINEILDLSKVEAEQAVLVESLVDVRSLAAACTRLVRRRADEKGVRLELDIPDSIMPLFADERMVKQILINLLSNAVKFTPAGGRVRFGMQIAPGGGHVMRVSDTGIGIANDDIPVALAPFRQIDSGLDRRYEGTGLGLPLSKALAELHGATLELESEVGVGTTVTVRFPARCLVSNVDTRVS